jgi:hypothetical protein
MGFLEKLRRMNNFWIGLILGILLPLSLFPLMRPFNPDNFAFIQSAYNITIFKLLPLLLSRCIFPNALLFFILIWSDFERAAKGILYATIGLVGILIIIQVINYF